MNIIRLQETKNSLFDVLENSKEDNIIEKINRVEEGINNIRKKKIRGFIKPEKAERDLIKLEARLRKLEDELERLRS